MRRPLLLLILSLALSQQVWAGITVEDTVFAYSPVTAGDVALGIPRWKMGMDSDGSNMIIICARGSGEDFGWIFTTDSGATWDTVYSNHSLDGNGGLNGHSAVWYWNDTVYVAMPEEDVSPASPIYRWVAAPFTSISDAGTLIDLGNYRAKPDYASRALPIANDDSSAVITRGGSNDSIMAYISNDDFAADTTYQAIDVVSTYHRIGTFMDYDTETWMYMVFDATEGFYYRKWDGSAFDGPGDSMIVAGELFSTARAFTMNYVNGLIHLIRSDGDHSTTSYLIHHMQDPSDSVGWLDPDTISSSTAVSQDVGYYPICVTYGDSLFVFYAAAASGGTFVYKMWDGSTWDADSTVITGDTSVDNYVNTVPYVPAGVGFIPFFWADTDNSIIFNKLTITPTTVLCKILK